MNNYLGNEIQKLKQGNFQDYQQFYQMTSGYIYKIIWNIVGDEEGASLVLTDTYNNIYQNINSLKNDNDFYQWAGCIATDLSFKHISARGEIGYEFLQEIDSESVNYLTAMQDDEKFIPSNILQDMELQRVIQGKLDAMPVTCKLVMQYFYYENLSVGDIATRLGTTEDNVKKSISYIKKTIKETLDGLPNDGNVQLRSMAEFPLLWVVFKNVLDAAMGDVATGMGAGAASVAGGTAAAEGAGAVAAEGVGAAVAEGAGAAVAEGAIATGGAVAGGAAATGTIATASAGAATGIIGTAAGKVVVGVITTALLATGGIAIHNVVTEDDTTTEITTEASVDDDILNPDEQSTDEAGEGADATEELTEDTTEATTEEVVEEDREFYDIKLGYVYADTNYDVRYFGHYETVSVEGTDYPELAEAVSTWQDGYIAEYTADEAAYIAEAANIADDMVWANVEYSLEVARSDDRIFSLMENKKRLAYAESYSTSGVAFDAKTGAQLTLEDMGEITDDLNAYVKTYMIENDPGNVHIDVYGQEYQDTIVPSLIEAGYEWWLTGDGVMVYFNSYGSDYLYSDVCVIVPYYKLPGFKAEYLPNGGSLTILPADGYMTDINGDGAEELIRVEAQFEDEFYGSAFNVYVGDNTTGVSDTYFYEINSYTYKDAESNYYVLVETTSDNDYRKLCVYSISADGIALLDEIGAGISYFSGDVFHLSEKFDVLGSYMGDVPSQITSTGVVGLNSRIELVNGQDGSYRHGPVTKAEVSVKLMQGGTLVDSTLPAGTTIYPVNTDNSSVLGFNLEDGTYGELTFEKREGEYGVYINGVHENELFEMIPYAG